MTATGEYSDVEYVFEPHASTMPNLREYVEALWARRQFMAQLAQSDLRTLRSSTALGSIWAVLEPLFQAAIYFFLYAVLRGGNSSQLQFLPDPDRRHLPVRPDAHRRSATAASPSAGPRTSCSTRRSRGRCSR